MNAKTSVTGRNLEVDCVLNFDALDDCAIHLVLEIAYFFLLLFFYDRCVKKNVISLQTKSKLVYHFLEW